MTGVQTCALPISDWFILPRNLPGRLNGDDFVYFIWDQNKEFNPNNYTVVVEVLDTSGAPYRSISMVKRSVELPHVQYGWHPRIGVIPNHESLPIFEAELIRGSTYIIPSTGGQNGRYQMERHGMHRPPGL